MLLIGSSFHFEQQQQHLQDVYEPEEQFPTKAPKRVWLEPFQNEPVYPDNDEAVPTIQDLLRARPKTACCLRDKDNENITKSKHEILVNLLNVMETRRIRKTAYSPTR